jgi:hypothetical protein
VKAPVGIQGNEMADRLAKEAAMDDVGEIVYDKIPRETIITVEKENGITKWQEQWTSCTKGAVSKLFFPHIKDRMQTMIPISAEFTATVTVTVSADRTSIDSRLLPIQHAFAD